MKFIKRLLFIVLLLLLAFFIYRLINPSAAKTLVQDVKTFSNDRFWTHFVVSTEIEKIIVETWTILEETGIILQETGAFLEDIVLLQEFDDEDALLLVDDSIEKDAVWNDLSVPESKNLSIPVTSVSSVKKTSTSSSVNSLDTQEEYDLQNLLDNFSID